MYLSQPVRTKLHDSHKINKHNDDYLGIWKINFFSNFEYFIQKKKIIIFSSSAFTSTTVINTFVQHLNTHTQTHTNSLWRTHEKK